MEFSCAVIVIKHLLFFHVATNKITANVSPTKPTINQFLFNNVVLVQHEPHFVDPNRTLCPQCPHSKNLSAITPSNFEYKSWRDNIKNVRKPVKNF